MKLSTRTRYGMRALLELALAHNAGPLQIKVIAERQNISNKYLEQLVAMLKTAGLVRSIRGPHGGYVLAKPPDEIKLLDVFKTLEGSTLTVECVDQEHICDNQSDCITRKLWMEINQAIITVLESKTLGDLVKMSEISGGKMSYQI
ncbi:MAG: Rrf2 family transcriptional regulator [Planctomycetaceae bacterium]|nr:Rrf2 family transcriptional regulator [Planctomycetaceae bacterium]